MYKISGRAGGRRAFTADQKDHGLESNQSRTQASLYFKIIF